MPVKLWSFSSHSHFFWKRVYRHCVIAQVKMEDEIIANSNSKNTYTE